MTTSLLSSITPNGMNYFHYFLWERVKREPYHSIDGYVMVVQSHPAGAGIAADWIVQVWVRGDCALTGKTGRIINK